jgi:hypothetical protein
MLVCPDLGFSHHSLEMRKGREGKGRKGKEGKWKASFISGCL